MIHSAIVLYCSNILAQKQETTVRHLVLCYLKVMMALELFHLEDVDGSAKRGRNLGQWYSDEILSGTTVI
jgi:hypothetical protein